MLERKMKGVEFSIRTVAMIALGLMVVVLLFMSFDQFFNEIVEEFVNSLEFGAP